MYHKTNAWAKFIIKGLHHLLLLNIRLSEHSPDVSCVSHDIERHMTHPAAIDLRTSATRGANLDHKEASLKFDALIDEPPFYPMLGDTV